MAQPCDPGAGTERAPTEPSSPCPTGAAALAQLGSSLEAIFGCLGPPASAGFGLSEVLDDFVLRKRFVSSLPTRYPTCCSTSQLYIPTVFVLLLFFFCY